MGRKFSHMSFMTCWSDFLRKSGGTPPSPTGVRESINVISHLELLKCNNLNSLTELPQQPAGRYTRDARATHRRRRADQWKRHILIVTAMMCMAAGAAAQNQPPRITARFVPDSIAIGDHFDLEVTVDKDLLQIVEFPQFEDKKLTEQIEILEESAPDTLEHEGRRVKLGKRYRLTTFEEGVHPVGRFPALYMDKNIIDTLRSADSLVLQVGTFEIDTLTMTIRDIKAPLNAPLKFGEISGYLGWGLLILAAVAALVWWIVSRRKNLTIFGKPKPVEPPHVKAIKALEILHTQKLWQNNKHKLYYTRLTDILREYLDGRYGIPAMEMTTDETLKDLTHWEIPKKNFDNLKEILSTADLVKFAKYVPEAETNETAYTNAYYFVENTKPTEIEAITNPDEQLKETKI